MKRKLKQFAALILATCFFLGIISLNGYAAAFSVSEQEALLKALDVINDNISNDVTLLNMAESVGKILGIYDQVEEFTESLPESIHPLNEGAGVINALVKLGVIKGNGKSIDLTEPVSMTNAIVILVRAVGYEEFAQLQGGYPTGYLRVATDLGIINKNTAVNTNNLQYNDLIRLIYNSLNVELLVKSSVFEGSVRYDAHKGNTLLSKVFSVEYVEGKVTGTNDTKYYSDEWVAEKNCVEIDGTVYQAGNTAINDYLGQYIIGYARFDDDKYTMITAYPHKKNTVAIVNDEDFISCTGNVISYYEQDRTKSLKVSDTTNVIYNSRFLNKYHNISLSEFWPKYGKVVFIDSDSDDIYETIHIHKKDVVMPKSYNNSTEKFICEDGQNINVSKSDKRIAMVKFENNWMDIESYKLTSNVVMEYEESLDGTIIKIEVITDKIDGIITGISDDEVTIDDVSYKFASIVELTSSLMDKSGAFYLNSEKTIIYTDLLKISKTEQYGYLIGIHFKEISDSLKFKIVTQKGSISEFEASDNFFYNNLSRTKAKKALFAAVTDSDKNVKIQLIKYKLNESGSISNIKLAGAEDFVRDITNASMIYKSPTKVLSLKVALLSNTPIFSVSSASVSDADKYRVISTAEMIHDRTYILDAYDMDENMIPGAIVVYQDANTVIGDSPLLVVHKLTKRLKEDGEEVIVVNGGYNGVITNEIWCSPDNEAIPVMNPGEIYLINCDDSGRITSALQVLNPSSSYKYALAPNTQNRLYYIYGTVVDINTTQNLVVVDVGTKEQPQKYVAYITSSYPGYIYNSKKQNVATATMRDICVDSVIYIKTRYDEPKEFVIYE